MSGHKCPEYRRKQAERARAWWADPENRRRQSETMSRIANTPKGRKDRSKAVKARFSRAERADGR